MMNYLKYVAMWIAINFTMGAEQGASGTWLEYAFGLLGALMFVITIDMAKSDGKFEK